jgi:hypothetical protein
MKEKRIPAIKIDWNGIRRQLAPYVEHEAEFAERWEQLPNWRAKSKPALMSQVQSWEFWTFPFHTIDPAHRLLTPDVTTTRRLAADPGKSGVVKYGLDADGRKIIQLWVQEFDVAEALWFYSEDRIDGFGTRSRNTSNAVPSPLFVESLFKKNGRPDWYFIYAESYKTIQLYQHENERIVRVLSACVQDDLVALGVPLGKWVYEVADITYDAKGGWRVRQFHDYRDHGYTWEGKPPKPLGATKIKIPVLDLRKDVEDSIAALQTAVKKFASRQSKNVQAVSGIGLGFFVSEQPEILIQFDTRPQFEPDGEWPYPEFARLNRARWGRFIEACEEARGKGAVIDSKGERHEITDISEEDRLEKWIGEALVTALKQARDVGLFSQLKTAARCELNVEESADGEFGWPRYEDRGKENLV